jgi:arylsulfatase A-like enzyme
MPVGERTSITRRDFVKMAGAATAGIALGDTLARAAGPAAPAARGRPNVLWVCTDQQRFDTIAALGNPHIQTPNLDRLVAGGVAFTHAFCQSPVCAPSRASFLTGRYPRNTGLRRNGQPIRVDEVLVTKMLADAGYDCGLAGKLHINPCQHHAEKRIADGYREFHWSHDPRPLWPENEYIQWLSAKGYKWKDVYHPNGRHAFAGVPADLHQTRWCAETAIDFLREKRSAPWLMSVNIFAPHHPFDPSKEFLERYDPDKMPDPAYTPGELADKPPFQRVDHDGAYGGTLLGFSKMTPRERREVTAAYYAMITQVDDNLGRMLKALDDSGQRENTIVIFMSDHGELLGDHGVYLKGPYSYDCSTRVPLVISWPGHFKAGLKSDALVELVDIAPTLLEAAGHTIPRRVQGESLTGICTGAADPHEHKDAVYGEYYVEGPARRKNAPEQMLTMLRTRDAKVTAYAGLEIGELYDLKADPGEHVNLWHSAAHRDLKADMLKRCFDASVLNQDPIPPAESAW